MLVMLGLTANFFFFSFCFCHLESLVVSSEVGLHPLYIKDFIQKLAQFCKAICKSVETTPCCAGFCFPTGGRSLGHRGLGIIATADATRLIER